MCWAITIRIRITRRSRRSSTARMPGPGIATSLYEWTVGAPPRSPAGCWKMIARRCTRSLSRLSARYDLMSVTVSIPTPLRSFTAGRDTVELAGDTVGQVLDGLLAAHTDLKRHLLQADGRLRNFVNLYLNETDIRHLASTATPVRAGDVLTIVPSIAGGATVGTEAPPLSQAE